MNFDVMRSEGLEIATHPYLLAFAKRNTERQSRNEWSSLQGEEQDMETEMDTCLLFLVHFLPCILPGINRISRLLASTWIGQWGAKAGGKEKNGIYSLASLSVRWLLTICILR